ncbi:ABC transporter ATP-binding protein [Nocardioides sp.]|uniref:ABC transporter ATP-binding protein n=1 Tax=Nocardioides sp. TaxID=35761 RepID=UPI00261D282A|nr:ABC transporter ATP-binding protein [Nocardioides sp.]
MTPPLVELREITVRLPDADRPTLDRVGLEIEEGELLLVSGPTGAGKSTLLGVLSGLVPRFSGGDLSGRFLLGGVDLTAAPPRERAERIGYVGQDPAAGFVTDTVEEELAYGMEQLGLAPATMRRRVEETLDLLGIADLRQRDLRTLSGGQAQRVAIGSVLTMHPALLVLDEPTSALDPTAAEEVLATLARLVEDLATTVVIAEHRLERVVPFADRIALLPGDGSLRVGEPAEMLADAPLAPPLIELGRALRMDPLPLTVRETRRRLRRELAVDRLQAPGPESLNPTPAPVATPTLAAVGVAVDRGRRHVLDRVDLRLTAGRVSALMGRNGSGKSTLLWTLQGTQERRAGRIRVTGSGGTDVDPADLKPAERRRHVGLLPQTASDLLYLETVAAECAAAGPTTRAILDRLVPGIPDQRHPRDLSEGQRLALALAIVLAADPPVLLLDEPTRGLDYLAKTALVQILREQAAAGRAVLVATHDVEFVAHVADDVVVLAEGEVVSEGPARRVVAETPAFAPQVTKVLGPGWLTVDEVLAQVAYLDRAAPRSGEGSASA